jgi:hypothetical protein
VRSQLTRHAEQLRDHLDRQQVRERRHEVEARRVHAVQQVAGQFRDAPTQAGDAARRERPRHQMPQPGVRRWLELQQGVLVEQVPRREPLDRLVRREDASQPAVTQQPVDVAMSRHQPHAGVGVPPQRRLRAQSRVGGIRVVEDLRRIEPDAAHAASQEARGYARNRQVFVDPGSTKLRVTRTRRRSLRPRTRRRHGSTI